MDTNAVLDKVAKGIEAAEPKVEEAIRKTLGEDAAKKFHDIAEKAEKALEDVSMLNGGVERRDRGATSAEGARIRGDTQGWHYRAVAPSTGPLVARCRVKRAYNSAVHPSRGAAGIGGGRGRYQCATCSRGQLSRFSTNALLHPCPPALPPIHRTKTPTCPLISSYSSSARNPRQDRRRRQQGRRPAQDGHRQGGPAGRQADVKIERECLCVYGHTKNASRHTSCVLTRTKERAALRRRRPLFLIRKPARVLLV